MDYFDQEDEKSRCLLVQPKATGMLLVIWCHTFTSFVVGFSEKTVTNICAIYREKVGFSMPKIIISNDVYRCKICLALTTNLLAC